MKIVLWIVGVLFALILLMVGLQLAASERVEVVELHTIDTTGEEITTRLWMVDLDGYQYLRGVDDTGWVQRLKSNEQFSLTRNGVRAKYGYQLRPEKLATINQLMNDKYTWGDDLIGLMLGGWDKHNAIELHPTSE